MSTPCAFARRDAITLGAALVLSRPRPAAAAVQDEPWLDTARGRELPVRLRWPATPGPWPWLVYSHGLGGSREGADVWGEAWREAGFAVLHMQHPGSDTEVIRSGGLRGLRALLWLDGADHMSFAGNRRQRIAGRGPFKRAAVAQQREAAHHALVARLSTQWWRWRLLGDTRAEALLQQAPGEPGWAAGDRLTLG